MDGHDERAFGRPPILLADDQGRHPEPRNDLRYRRQRPEWCRPAAVVDTELLELVRLGVKLEDDPIVLNTITVVKDSAGELGVEGNTPNGTFWHRYDFDGYGEQADGFSVGRRLRAAGRPANHRPRLAHLRRRARRVRALGRWGSASSKASQSIAASGNEGYMLPEQVWDDNPPSGTTGFPRGEGTLFGHTAGLDARPVRAPGVVHRSWAPD